jgi:hypothetical protein
MLDPFDTNTYVHVAPKLSLKHADRPSQFLFLHRSPALQSSSLVHKKHSSRFSVGDEQLHAPHPQPSTGQSCDPDWPEAHVQLREEDGTHASQLPPPVTPPPPPVAWSLPQAAIAIHNENFAAVGQRHSNAMARMYHSAIGQHESWIGQDAKSRSR